MSPIPIPTLNIIATQDDVLNSGSSSSLPSLILPYREKARKPTKIKNANVASIKTQPKVSMRNPNTAGATAERLSVKNTPHTTKSMEMPKETQNTPGSIVDPAVLRIVAHLPLTFAQSNTPLLNRNRCDRTSRWKRCRPRSGRGPGAKQPGNVDEHTTHIWRSRKRLF